MRSTTPDAVLPPVGSFLLNAAGAPTDTADVCTDCAQFGAVVTAVGAAQACSSGGTPCVEVQLTTRPAILSEVFTAEALAIIGLSQFAGATFFEAAGCVGGAGRRLAGTSPRH